MKSFTEFINLSLFVTKFGYCPLICMLHGRGVDNKINYLRMCSLRILYKDNSISFKDALKKDNSFAVHHIDIQSLATELFKVKEDLLNTMINDILQTTFIFIIF